ncbi:spore germination protein [Cohnella terricola]|uniref:Spore germination protein n=1 Tax=Cohnella terricola TaxID=1289167 RepID=A0A559JTA2_9BACL|nr:spore germination protein [Cohnella terricola]TVY03060.1 spore germination protein [Cohnella terricola]
MLRSEKQSLQGMEKRLYDRFRKSSDFTCRTVVIANEEFRACYLESLVNLRTTLSTINQNTVQPDNDWTRQDFHALEDEDDSVIRLSYELLRGNLILFNKEDSVTVIEPEQPDISRSIAIPNSENPIQSAFDAFTEDIDRNIGLLRKKMISDQLVIETRFIGGRSVKKLAVIYLEGTARPKVIESIRKSLDENSDKELTTARDLTRMLGHPKFAITPTYISSELPTETVQNLMNGKVVILVDQLSFAFAFPAIVTDLWTTTMDANFPQIFQVFLRIIRVGATLLAVTLPGLYVVLNSVNPELLRIQLAITVAKSREGVPYPSIIEMLLVLLLLEMIIEATIRLPKNIGPTITMIGGILLGQAIVQAKLVSNLLIIILVASAIANFAHTSYMNAIGIRIYKYVVMIASSFFGILGLEGAMIWITLYFASLTTCSVPYLSLSLKGQASDE